MNDSDIREALRLIAQRKANAEAGPCPHCGGELHVDLMDTSDYRRPSWMAGAGDGKCIARCWQSDPDGYVASRNARKSFIAPPYPRPQL